MTEVLINVSPENSLFDEPVDIEIINLSPRLPVTVQSLLTTERKDVFLCFAHYESTKEGVVSLKSHPAIGGMYKGVEPMGLFWGMEASQTMNRRNFVNYIKANVCTPQVVEITVFKHHLNCEKVMAHSNPLQRKNIMRSFISPEVQRVKVTHGRLRGYIFVPRAPGTYPGVLDIRGYGGGCSEYRAALLANHGFVTLALGYFAYEDLPKSLEVCDLEYFEEGVNYLLSHPKVYKRGVGAIGTSFGGSIAQALLTYVPRVLCAVTINGPPYALEKIKYKQRTWSGLQIPLDSNNFKNGIIIRKDDISVSSAHNMDRNISIEVHKAKGPIMIIVGEDDQMMPSAEVSKLTKNQLDSGRKRNYVILRYPQAGHLIEPPYAPFYDHIYQTVLKKYYAVGGTKRGAAFANEDAWRKCKEFLWKNIISCNDSKM